MSSDKLIKLLKSQGWYKVHQKGSHTQFKHKTIAGKITVPHPKKDLPQGTVAAILKQAGVSA
jgi:predicted RNA binding protein YcfA (HicA-like mRNA interferase family)